MERSWFALLEAIAKLVAATGLFAYLLHLGGLHSKAVTVVTLAHLMALLCISPCPGELILFWTLIQGTCTYAVLAVDRPRLRASIVISCPLAIFADALPELPAVGLVLVLPMALWTGLMVTIRDWARKPPAEHRQPA
jgi:hypothetical protein